jgi:hypothetical protein
MFLILKIIQHSQWIVILDTPVFTESEGRRVLSLCSSETLGVRIDDILGTLLALEPFSLDGEGREFNAMVLR